MRKVGEADDPASRVTSPSLPRYPVIIRLLGGGLLAVGVLVAFLKFVPAPFIWIWLVWGALGIAGTAISRGQSGKMVCLFVAAICLSLGAFEGWLWITDPGHPPKTIEYSPARPFIPDPILGWRLVPGQITHATSRAGRTLIYDVVYTVNASGQRVTPPVVTREPQGCVLFFVDSFAFGEGVQDEDSLPYRVGILTSGRYRVINFGAPGYGAEHMLASIERSLVQSHSPCRPTHVVYEALPHHVARVTGATLYSRLGPHYALGAAGSVVYTGTGTPQPVVAPPPSRSRRVILRADELLRRSRVYEMLLHREVKPQAKDVELYFAVVAAARDRFAAEYPGVQFHVLAWSLDGFEAGSFDRFREGLERITPHVHRVDRILPKYSTTPQPYELHRLDRHASALANDLLAQYVAHDILSRE
jgi:hypothetical protein